MSTSSRMTVKPSCTHPRACVPVARIPGLAGSSLRGTRVASRRSASSAISRKTHTVTAAAATAVDSPAEVSKEVVELAINAIRFLSIDAVNKANSGHPGMPMGCAPMAYLIWNEFMHHNPNNPFWFNRDRFVLSAGHGSMLIYSLLHLSGYPSVTLDDTKQFRQLNSKTPGHPENFVTDGVEVTTGPLGQGIANAVGLAAAEAHLAARFNKPDTAPIVDHYTYAIMGDGCNMEGISNEAASLAGHWGLGKLIALYDDNKISIDGDTDISFTEDVSKRYEALGWHVQHVPEGNTDIDALRAAIAKAKEVTDKPSMIKVTTLIGYGSPNKAGSHDVHGAPLGADETSQTREKLAWKYGEFEVPQEAYDVFGRAKTAGGKAEKSWEEALAEYGKKYPEEHKEFTQLISGELPAGWADALPKPTPDDKGKATRLHSQDNLNAASSVLSGFVGGSADLAPSNMTLMKAFGDFQKASYQERNFRFGVREHGMGAIANGLALHRSGLIPYCATFFIFTDYMRAAIRMAALSHAGVLFVMTHDSIGLGEDGPTHQPIEHLASFRAMPNILMLRPGDGIETSGAYKVAIENTKGQGVPGGKARPSVLALSRQGMPNQPGTSIEGVAKGAYTISGGEGKPDVILIGTGTELQIAVDAGKELEGQGKKVRVVSMPSWELFEEQSQEYKDSVFPPDVTARVSIEAGSTFGWLRYVGAGGKSIGVDTFGASAPGPALYEMFGITVKAVVDAANSL